MSWRGHSRLWLSGSRNDCRPYKTRIKVSNKALATLWDQKQGDACGEPATILTQSEEILSQQEASGTVDGQQLG